jgi:hypothetical protein
MRIPILALIFLAACGGGCRQRPDADTSEPLGPEEYGSLPGLRATPNLKLRDELARIVEEGGTPEQLSKVATGDEKNAAVVLRELFPRQQVKSLLETSAAIFPPREFTFDPIRLEKAINFRKKYEPERQQAGEALQRPQCAFGIRFTAGFCADLGFVDIVRLCGRLEAFQAAESLFEDNVTAAIESFSRMMRLASCLAAEQHPVPRLEAAQLRSEAFRVLQAIVQHERMSRQNLGQLCDLVSGQLAAWPSDASAWIGDRALGLHAYEMVRRGQMLQLLTDKEGEQFRQENSLAELSDAAQRSVDQDELYYLETMRKIIGCCNQPFYARAAVFDGIDNDLRQRQDTAGYPLVAARLLLPEIRQGHEAQARDRANWQAWALALALATGRDAAAYKANPLSAKDYTQIKQDGLVVVKGIGTAGGGDDSPILVPIPASP